jgi:hypothetical protein
MMRTAMMMVAALALAGCGTARGVDVIEAPLAEAPPVPPLPADLAVPCEDPGLTVGQDARSALARNRAALKTCIDRHGRTVQFYQDVRDRSAPVTATAARPLR